MFKCSNCGRIIENEKFCPDCGTPVQKDEDVKYCDNCGRIIENEKFCPDCGTAIQKEDSLNNNALDNHNIKYCTNCGEMIEKYSQFCSNCGNQINYNDKFNENYENKIENDKNTKKTINDAEVTSSEILKETIPNLKRDLNHMDSKDILLGPIYTIWRKRNRAKNYQCMYCGTPYEDGATYCIKCGNNLRIQRKSWDG